jgi:hypothetical protein
MLLTRIWFLVLAVAAILGLSTALLARGMFNREEMSDADELLRRDRFGVESLLKLDARARIDALAPIAADGAVREAVRGKRSDSQGPDKALKDRLRTMNQQLEELRADMLIAVNADGLIVAQEGRSPARAGAGLGKVPLVERALSGYLGDDVWIYDDAVYRMAARPIVDRGIYAGALIHGQKLDATLAQRLSERLGGPSVAFFWGDHVLAIYTPTDVAGAPTQTEIIPALAAAFGDERFKRGERTEPVALAERGRAVFSLVAGSASAADVGYALARPYATLATPMAIFQRATKDDIRALPKTALAGGLAVLVLLAMGIVYLERDRPLAILNRQLERMARGEIAELDLPSLNRAHRNLGEHVHKALETMVEKGGGRRTKPKANLDEILGPTPESMTSSAFSFGNNPDAAPVAVTGLAQPAPMPPPAPRVGSPVAAPPPPPKAALASPQAAAASPPAAAVASSADDAHFREVFEQYVATRRQCGESTAELTFDKLASTLRKNREQILGTRDDLSAVRFSVYVKDGRAAIKANPLKA